MFQCRTFSIKCFFTRFMCSSKLRTIARFCYWIICEMIENGKIKSSLDSLHIHVIRIQMGNGSKPHYNSFFKLTTHNIPCNVRGFFSPSPFCMQVFIPYAHHLFALYTFRLVRAASCKSVCIIYMCKHAHNPKTNCSHTMTHTHSTATESAAAIR